MAAFRVAAVADPRTRSRRRATGVFIDDNVSPWNIKTWSLIRQSCDTKGCVDDPSDLQYAWPIVVGMTRSDGEALVQWKGRLSLTSWDDD